MNSAHPPGNQPGTSIHLLDEPEVDLATPAYVLFSQSLDAQLDQLVAKWQHLAAPRALLTGRTSTIRTPTPK